MPHFPRISHKYNDDDDDHGNNKFLATLEGIVSFLKRISVDCSGSVLFCDRTDFLKTTSNFIVTLFLSF